MDASRNVSCNSRDLLDLPQPPPPIHPSQHNAPRNSPNYRHLPLYHPPAIHTSQGSIQREPYRLSEGRLAADGPYNLGAERSARVAIRQPLNSIPLGYYGVYGNLQPSGNQRNGHEQEYYGGPSEAFPDQPLGVRRGELQENQSAPLPFIRPRLQRPQVISNTDAVLDPGLLTFRVEPNGQSAVVIKHSEGVFQPGQLLGYQVELATCFESKMCPICQEEWIWKVFTPAEMAFLDPSGAEWEVARLPCGHAFHGACLAVWFHEISTINPSSTP